ncbi:hypothetical protein INT45_011940 [Circinella minor]|uniref:Uncharacterized protein n=1 Tax=Circinella minor TaxID=1195481 RepID=A0A8H7VDJ3_9FUNG|nr:hypothetical protein INT45_011940 [Circinella minor]
MWVTNSCAGHDSLYFPSYYCTYFHCQSHQQCSTHLLGGEPPQPHTSLPVSDHVFASPASVRRAGAHRAAIGSAYAIAPTSALPDPTPARWVNADRVAMGNTVPIAPASVFALPAVDCLVSAGATVPGVPVGTVIISPATPTTTFAASSLTTTAAAPVTTSTTVPTTTTTTASPPATSAAIPATTSSATPPRLILTRDPSLFLVPFMLLVVFGLLLVMDLKHRDLEYMEEDWCEGNMDVDIVPLNATFLWF